MQARRFAWSTAAAVPIVAVSTLGTLGCGPTPAHESARLPPPATNADHALPALSEARRPRKPPMWTDCENELNTSDRRTECADVEVPLDWDNPIQNRTIRIRRVSPVGTAKVDLWLVAGGPGISSSMAFEPLIDHLRPYLPDVSFHMIDARGTGASAHVTCAGQEAADSAGGVEIVANEVADCARDLGQRYVDLGSFGLTQVTRDLAEVLAATSAGERRVFLWAQSAGTVIAQRLLLLQPSLVEGAILEGAVPPDFSEKLVDDASGSSMTNILGRCAARVDCASRLGKDPSAFVRRLWRKLDAGHCAALGLDTEQVQHVFFRLIAHYPLYAMVPALIFRVDRCEASDVAVTKSVFELASPGTTVSPAFSQPVFQLVTASELWQHERFASEQAYLDHLVGLYESSPLERGSLGHVFGEKMAKWPIYRAKHDDAWPSVGTPLLFLHGALDSKIPREEIARMEVNYAKPFQRFADFPHASHAVVGATPTIEGTECASSLVLQFLRDPETVSLDCVAQTVEPDWEGRDWAPALLGKQTYWDDEVLLPADAEGSRSERKTALSAAWNPELVIERVYNLATHPVR